MKGKYLMVCHNVCLCVLIILKNMSVQGRLEKHRTSQADRFTIKDSFYKPIDSIEHGLIRGYASDIFVFNSTVAS